MASKLKLFIFVLALLTGASIVAGQQGPATISPYVSSAGVSRGDIVCASNNGCNLGNGSTFFNNAFIGTGTITTVSTSAPAVTAGADATVVVANQVERVVYKATVTSATCNGAAGFIVAGLNADCVVATLPAKTEITRVVVDNTAGFTCSATCTGTKTVQFGKTTGGTEYVIAKDATVVATYGLVNGDLGAALATTATTPVGGGDLPSFSGTTTLKARWVSGTGNWGNGSVTNVNAGSTTFYIETVKFP